MDFLKIFRFADSPSKQIESSSKVEALKKLSSFDLMDMVFKSMPDPEQFVNKMGGRRELSKLYFDDAIFFAVNQRRSELESLSWDISGDDEKESEFIYQSLKDLVPIFTEYGFNATLYGNHISEVVWSDKIIDGKKYILPSFLIDQRIGDYGFDYLGNLTKLLFNNNSKYQPHEIPERYFVVRNRPTSQNPYGESLFMRLYWPYFFRCKGYEFYAKFIERTGIPFLYGKTKETRPNSSNPKDSSVNQLMEALSQAHSGSALATDKETEITVLDSKSDGTSQAQFLELVEKRIYKTILGQTLTSGTDDSGSRSLGEVHKDILRSLAMTDGKMIAKGINQLIRHIYSINNKDTKNIPVFQYKKEESLGKDRAERDAILVNAGAIKLTEKYLLERYDYNDGDIEMGVKDNIKKEVPDPTKTSQEEYQFADKKFTSKQEAVEEIGDLAIQEAPTPLTVDELRSVIAGAENEADLEDRLAVLIGRDHPEFTDTLTNSLFAASVLGYLNN
jgi:phage gp29-like protein